MRDMIISKKSDNKEMMEASLWLDYLVQME